MNDQFTVVKCLQLHHENLLSAVEIANRFDQWIKKKQKQKKKQTDRETDRQADRQRDRQAGR